MAVYYNENDAFVADWLRNLIKERLIADGDVDDRDIRDVLPSDLKGYERHHFFAGVGGWELATQLSSWDGPVWTGSCPCQPFSIAGRKAGVADERHLWPSWFHLIRHVRPPVIFGEQVASNDGLAWLDLVFDDLEGENYSVGAADLPAACVGAPHIRQRLWFVAYSAESRLEVGSRRTFPKLVTLQRSERLCPTRRVGYSNRTRLEGRLSERQCSNELSVRTRSLENPWNTDIDWIECTDGKRRPTQSRVFPLAKRVPSRVGRIRAYGNAVVPQVAAFFIRSFMECANWSR